MRLPLRHCRSQSQAVGPQVTHNFFPPLLHIRGSHDSLTLGFDYLPESFTEVKETLRFTSLLKDMIMNADEQLDEERCIA